MGRNRGKQTLADSVYCLVFFASQIALKCLITDKNVACLTCFNTLVDVITQIFDSHKFLSPDRGQKTYLKTCQNEVKGIFSGRRCCAQVS